MTQTDLQAAIATVKNTYHVTTATRLILDAAERCHAAEQALEANMTHITDLLDVNDKYQALRKQADDMAGALEQILEHDPPPAKLWIGDAVCTTRDNPRLLNAVKALDGYRKERGEE